MQDILELSLSIGGLLVDIADTASLRKTEDVIEKIGVERAPKGWVLFTSPSPCSPNHHIFMTLINAWFLVQREFVCSLCQKRYN